MLRRDLLKLLGITTSAAGFGLVPTLSVAGPETHPKRLGIIILEGGMDGLASVPPVGDEKLFDQRPDLIDQTMFEINSDFGLSSSFENFYSMMAAGEASIIHASAFPYIKRSHFEGQNVIQSGLKTPFSADTGWLGRALAEIGMPGRTLSLSQPLITRGYSDIETIYPARIRGAKRINTSALEALSGLSSGHLRASLKKVEKSISDGTIDLPRDPVSLAFTAGQAMAQPDGPISSVIYVRGFDTHAQQGSSGGPHQANLRKLDSIFKAYREGLGDRWSETVIMTITEFGRTVKMNGSHGTDHGYGTATLLAGGLLKEGTVLTEWPGLKNDKLFERRDLMSTVDLRSIMCAAIEATLGIPHEHASKEIFQDSTISNIGKYLFS